MQKNILGTILITKQLLHDFHSMKKRKKINTLLESMGTRNLLVMNILQISYFMLRWTKKFIQVQNNSRLSKWWQYFHFWVNYPFKISSYNSRNSHSLLHFTCMLIFNYNVHVRHEWLFTRILARTGILTHNCIWMFKLKARRIIQV